MSSPVLELVHFSNVAIMHYVLSRICSDQYWVFDWL